MIPNGYKQTEIGVIPEDWDVRKIGDFTDATAGGTPSTSHPEYWNGEILWMSSGELNNRRIHNVIGRITELGYNNSSTHMIPENCVLMGLAGQGKTRGTVAINYVELCTNQSIAAIFPSKEHNSEYLYQNLWSRYEELRELSSGDGGRGGLNLTIIKNFPCAFPKLQEQKRIADALSDVDSMISSLEKLIEKKKSVKQGAMQELLTGKKRLPGFTGEWVDKRIDTIAEVGRGRVISHKEIEKNIGGKYPVYSSQTTNNGIMGFLRTFDFDGDYITWTTDGVNAGTVFYRNGKFNCTNVCGTLRVKQDNPYFVAIRLSIETPSYVATNLANPKLMNDVMKKIIISLPPTIEEQTAIASILSDMDNEIEALEQKLAKTRQLKQGMMQQLLTGKIRLV